MTVPHEIKMKSTCYISLQVGSNRHEWGVTTLNDDVEQIGSKIEAINEENLSSIKEDVQGIGSKVNSLITKELPKYKKFFAETEVKTEERVLEFP